MELHGKGQSDERTAVDFLLDTRESCDNYPKLPRPEDILTETEQHLPADLRSTDETDGLL